MPLTNGLDNGQLNPGLFNSIQKLFKRKKKYLEFDEELLKAYR